MHLGTAFRLAPVSFHSLAYSGLHFVLCVNIKENKIQHSDAFVSKICHFSGFFFKGGLHWQPACLLRKPIWMSYCPSLFFPPSLRLQLPRFLFFRTWKTPSLSSPLVAGPTDFLQSVLRHPDCSVCTGRILTYSNNPVAWANHKKDWCHLPCPSPVTAYWKEGQVSHSNNWLFAGFFSK